MKTFVVVTILLILPCCTTTIRHPTALPQLQSEQRLIAEVVDESDGEQVVANKEVVLSKSSIGQWKDAELNVPIADAKVKTVGTVSKDHGRGARDGALIGLGSGVAAGSIFGYASWHECIFKEYECDAFLITRGEQTALFGVLGGLSGVAIGAVIGAVVGHRTHDLYTVPVVQVNPTRDGASASATWRF